MLHSMLLQVILLFFVILTFSSHAGSKRVENKELKREESLAWLSDNISWIPWLFRSIIYLIYLIINTVVNTFTHIMATVISLLQQSIKLVELVGYCVRLVLQANYNFVSSCVTKTRRLVENCYVLSIELSESTVKTLISLVNTILRFLHSIVVNMPKIYEFTGIGLKTTVKMAGTLTHKTNSTFGTFVSMIKAVVELFGRSIVNTLKLMFDLLYHILLSCAHFFQFVGKIIITAMFNVCKNAIFLLERLGNGIETVISTFLHYTKEMFHGGIWFIKVIFSTLYDMLLSVLQTIGLFVRQCGRFICDIFIGLGRFINSTARSMTLITTQLISIIKSSRLSVASISSFVLIVSSLWLVFKINIFMVGFGFLETSIQHVALWMTKAVQKEETTIKESQSNHKVNSTCSSTSDEETLRRQLELEREKSLCVVCQDQMKKILLLPCRHMCICVMCANHLTSFTHWNRRVCPLCRTRIGSMVEVYS